MMKPRSPRLRFLGRVAGLSVYLVSGELVRDDIDIEFTMGGNEAVYTYVPPGEIWLDDAMHVLDRVATTLHEMVERDQMLHHGLDYDSAHDVANGYERAFRRELVRRRPTKFDPHAVAVAYRAYLRDTPIVMTGRSSRSPVQLDREINESLSRRRGGQKTSTSG